MIWCQVLFTGRKGVAAFWISLLRQPLKSLSTDHHWTSEPMPVKTLVETQVCPIRGTCNNLCAGVLQSRCYTVCWGLGVYTKYETVSKCLFGGFSPAKMVCLVLCFWQSLASLFWVMNHVPPGSVITMCWEQGTPIFSIGLSYFYFSGSHIFCVVLSYMVSIQ